VGGDVDIALDSLTSGEFVMMTMFESGEETFLIGLDIVFQSVNVYSLSRQALIKRLFITDEGPNAMSKIDGMYFHNFDSIFLVHRYPTEMYLVDSSGTVKRKWDTSKPLPHPYSDYKYLLEVSFFNDQVYFSREDNSLYVQLFFDVRPSLKAFSMPLVGKYSLDESVVVTAFCQRPKEFLDLVARNKFYGALRTNPRFVVLDGSAYVAYPFEHWLRVYNVSTGEEIDRKEIKSDLVEFFSTTSMTYSGQEDEYEHHTIEPAYHNFIYDHYRNVFYRIVKCKQRYKDSNGKKNLYNEASWSLMVLDRSLNVIGEAVLPEKMFDFTKVFVGKRGIIVKRLAGSNSALKLVRLNLKSESLSTK